MVVSSLRGNKVELVALIRDNYIILVCSSKDNFALKTDFHGCGLRVILVAGESGDAEC
jgi:hypothetical protein